MYQILKNMMIPKRTLIYMAVCLFGILITVFIGIIPNWFSNMRLDRKISELQLKLEEQKQIYPVYELLKNNDHQKSSMVLPFPAKNKLLRESVESFPGILKTISREAGMDALSISPDINLLSSGSKFLIVDAVIRGDFFDFRNLLIGLGKVPYLDSVEEIRIQRKRDFMEFKLKIRLVLA